MSTSPQAGRKPKRRAVPHENSYWLPGDRLLAGDYPGATTDTGARKKLNALLDAGVRRFIDLTESRDPLRPYRHVLFEEAAKRGIDVEHHAHGLPDMGVPESPDDMSRIITALAEGESRSDATYVHCWGGIGRTGTVVGCYLISKGESPEGALTLVQQLYSTMSADKVARHPRSPQTTEQREYVLEWRKQGAARE